MKKNALLIGLITMLSACSSSTFDVETPAAPDNANESLSTLLLKQTFSNGSSMTITSSAAGATMSRADIECTSYPGEALDPTLIEPLTEIFLEHFPPGQRNLLKDHSSLQNYSYDFAMVSSGEPFTVYPLLVGGDARNVLGISYFDGAEWHDVDIIDLTDDSVIGNPDNGWVNIQSGVGTTVCLPAGVPYQFYIYNSHRQGTPLHGGKFYSDAERNYNSQVHAVTFNIGDGNFVGFEDLDLEAKQGVDFDYNDLILMITPRQDLLREVTVDIPIDIDKALLCEVDDFALSNNVERYPETYNIGGDPDKKIFIDRLADLRVKIDDFDNLTFNEEYNEWTYETWVWLNEPVDLGSLPGKYIIGAEDAPDYSYSQDDFNIGVSAYLGNQADGTAGYVKVSIHISRREIPFVGA